MTTSQCIDYLVKRYQTVGENGLSCYEWGLGNKFGVWKVVGADTGNSNNCK
jgi:hypothetical protein